MGITGKYNFPGLQKAGRIAITAALAASSWGAALLASPWFKFFAPVEDEAINTAINILANQGLIILNIGAIFVDGKFDQSAFDKAMADGIQKIQLGRDKLTPEQGKAIDDAIRKAFDNDVDLGATTGMSNISAPPV